MITALKANIDRDDLDVTEDTVLILRNAGPLGGPGMPEWGMLPFPRSCSSRASAIWFAYLMPG